MSSSGGFILPNGEQQFCDQNGAPYGSGAVYFYVPNTTTAKLTWSDSGLTTPNSNPVRLDAAGRAVIWGSGVYRQILVDAFGNQIWDKITTSAVVGSISSFTTTAALLAAFSDLTVLLDGALALTTGRTVEGDGGGGEFYYKASDTTTADNGGTIRVDAQGRRWYAILPSNTVNVLMFGAVGNGVANDQPAIQKAVTYVLTLVSGSIYWPKGTYKLNSTVLITHAKGINMLGDGPDHTILQAGAFPAIATVGFWRSIVQGIQFSASGNTTGGAFQMDGETDGSFGVQGNLFQNCMFNGNFTCKYCFTNVLVAGNSGQGSENDFIGCSWIAPIVDNSLGVTASCFYNGGNNAVQNNIYGGNFQSFISGIYLNGGNVNCYSVGFQSVAGYSQISFGGADINGSGAFAGDFTISDGCRSESLVHVKGVASSIVRGFTQQSGVVNAWAANHTFASNEVVKGQTANGNVKLYVWGGGTTGGSVPTWPESGTVADGTGIWTFVEYDVIGGGHPYVTKSQIQYGASHNTTDAHYVDTVFSRYDVFQISNGGCPKFDNCVTGGAPPPGNAGTPVKVTSTSATWISPTALGNGPAPQLDLLSGVALFRGADSGGANLPYYDVGYGRQHGDRSVKLNNTSGPYLGLQCWSDTFTNISAATPPNGTMYYCSDGVPGSNPLRGSGSGCIAVYQNSIWVGAGVSGWQMIAASAVQVTHTGDTTETTLATIILPANVMGANGVVKITVQLSFTGTAGTKEIRLKFGGTTYTDIIGTSAQLSGRFQCQLANRNATGSQVGNQITQGNFTFLSAGVSTTSAVDTTAAVTILITGQLGNSGDTFILESYTVEAYHGV